MAHDVFISYSVRDRHSADALCHKLEEDDIRCWIAPRDISPGGSWAGEIADAIPESQIMILIFSSNSNSSKQVLREVELAITNNITIIPLKIEDTSPTGGMSYYLSTTHWIDAVGHKFDKRINSLSKKIRAMVGIKDDLEQPELANAEKHPEEKFLQPDEQTPEINPRKKQKKSSGKREKLFMSVILGLIVISLAGYFIYTYWLIDILPFGSKNSDSYASTHSPNPISINDLYNSSSDNGENFDQKINSTYSPEEFGFNPEQPVNIIDKDLKNAIINTLNATRELPFNTDDELTIADMFELKYLVLISPDEINTNQDYSLIQNSDGSKYAELVISYPDSIFSLNGLQYAKNLTAFYLIGYPLEDFSPISNIDSLTGLFLKTRRWIDPASYMRLDNLVQLGLNGVIDQEAISNIVNLSSIETLSLSFISDENFPYEEFVQFNKNPITDFGGFENLKSLNNLTLENLYLENIETLGNLETLEYLNLSKNMITDITPLLGFKKLRHLDLSNNMINDISLLTHLNTLRFLNLRNNPIINPHVLESLGHLIELYIDDAIYYATENLLEEIKYNGTIVNYGNKTPEDFGYDENHVIQFDNDDLKNGLKNSLMEAGFNVNEEITIKDMFRFENLIILHNDEELDENYLQNFPISFPNINIVRTDNPFSLEFLQYAANLKFLHVSSYEIQDISVLSSLNSLVHVAMPGNKISDLSPFNDLNAVRYAVLFSNNISDISPLFHDHGSIEFVQLFDNEISDLSVLANYNFECLHLHLERNNINDLSSLANMSNLNLRITDNPVSDLSILLNITGLNELIVDNQTALENDDIIKELKNRGCEIIIEH